MWTSYANSLRTAVFGKVFSCYTFHGIDPLNCSNPELTSEAMNKYSHFGRSPWTGD
jgi:hypothetical protein